MQPFRLVCHAFVVLSLVCSLAHAARKVDPKLTVGPAVSANLSIIALVDLSTDELQLFRSIEDAPFARVPVSSSARAVHWKPLGEKGVFVVLCEGDNGVYVHDDATGRQIGKYTIGENMVGSIAVDPRKDGPYVYYASHADQIRQPQVVGRINLQTAKDEGWLKLQRTDPHLRRLLISLASDGRSMYAYRSGTSPTGVFRFDIEEPEAPGQPATLVQRHSAHATWHDPLPDPAGRFVASRDAVRSFDAQTSIGKLSGSPVCALTKRPVLFVWFDEHLEALSSNDFRTLGRVHLRKYLVLAEPEPRRGAPEPFNTRTHSLYEDKIRNIVVEPDERGGRLIVRIRSRIFEVPLRDFNLPEEPIVAAPIIGETEVQTGATWTALVKPADPRVKVALQKAPDGMKLEAGKLTWTPTGSQIGTHRVEMQVSWDKLAVAQTMELQVRGPSLKLPFMPTFMHVSPDGSKTLCGLPGGRDFHSGREEQKPAELLLVDNNTLKIIARRTLPEPITSATLDDQHVYVSLSAVAVIKVLSTKDLSETRQIFKKDLGGTLSLVGSKLLAAGFDQRSHEWFDRNDLKPSQVGVSLPNHMSRNPVVFDDKRLEHAGVEYDLQTFKPIALTENLTTAAYGQRTGGPVGRVEVLPPEVRFGSAVVGQQVLRVSKAPISLSAQGRSRAMVLPDMPAVAAISVEIGNRHTGGEGPPRLRATLDLRDLVTGSQLASTQLQDELYDPNERAIQGMDQYALMSATPKQLVVVILDRLHRVDTTPFAKLELPMPLLLTEKEVPSVVGDKPATLTWEVVGGKPPMRYELANPVPGVTLVDGSPAVRIDPAAFAQLAPEQLWRSLMNHHNGGNTATERLQKYAQREQTRIKDLLGLELKQIPAAMWINLRVTDAENQTYTASRLVLIDLPQSAFDQQIAAMQRQMEQAQAGRQPVANPNVGDDAALRQRIADLERENARLQGQVQVLTELLQNARPATQPAR